MSLSDREIERYSRQIIVAGGVVQERLRAARVVIVGGAREAESLVYYLAGAGIGHLMLDLRDHAATAELTLAHAQALNSDVEIVAAVNSVPSRFDVAVILAEGFTTEALIEQLAQYSPSGCVIGANLMQGRMVVLVSAPRCLRCVVEKLLARTALLDDNSQYSTMLLAMESIHVSTNQMELTSSLIELEGLAMRNRPIEEIDPASCKHLFSGIEPRAWLFDFDNTLVALEREVDWAASRIELEAFLRASGVAEDVFAAIPKGNLPLYEALRADLLGEASARIEAYERRGVERARELPGAAALLRRLRRRGSAAAIVTSNAAGTVRRWLEREQLEDCVDAIVGRDAMLPLKPAADSIYRALALLGARAEDAVFVGDSAADREAARGAGIRFIEIRSNSSSDGASGGGNVLARLDSPQELLDKLDAASDR